MAVGVGVGVGFGVGLGVGLGVRVGVGVGPEVVGVGVTSKDGVGDTRSVGRGVNEPGSGEKKKGVGVGAGVACGEGVSCVKSAREGPGVPVSPISPNDCCGCGGVDR